MTRIGHGKERAQPREGLGDCTRAAVRLQSLVQQSRFRWQGPRVVFSVTAASTPRGHFDPGCQLHSSQCYSSCSNIGVVLLATTKCQKGCEASCFLSVSCCWMQRSSFNLWVRHCVGHNTLSNQVCIYSKPFDKGDVLLTLILNMMKCLSV